MIPPPERFLKHPIPSRPPKVKFIPKNPEITVLDQYTSDPPQEHWTHWPFTPIPDHIVTPIDVDAFAERVKQSSGHMKSRLNEVLSDLYFGADTLVKGDGRQATCSGNAPSAYAAGPRTSDAIASMIKLGFIAGPFSDPPFHDSKISGLMAVEKPDGSIRPVINLSFPDKISFNSGIEKEELWPARMDSARKMVVAIDSAGPNSDLMKKDQKKCIQIYSSQEKRPTTAGFSLAREVFC